MLLPDPLTFLSLVAGALCAASTAPENIATLLARRRGGQATELSPRLRIARNATLSFGNGLWVLYGTLTGQIAIQIFCSITFLLAGALSLQQFSELRQLHGPKGGQL